MFWPEIQYAFAESDAGKIRPKKNSRECTPTEREKN